MCHGASVAVLAVVMDFFRRQRAELARHWREARHHHPRIAAGVLATAAVLATAVLVATFWFLIDLRRGMPDLDAVRRIGEMDQATTVFDAADKLAFTIYKEQRIEVPLSE